MAQAELDEHPEGEPVFELTRVVLRDSGVRSPSVTLEGMPAVAPPSRTGRTLIGIPAPALLTQWPAE